MAERSGYMLMKPTAFSNIREVPGYKRQQHAEYDGKVWHIHMATMKEEVRALQGAGPALQTNTHVGWITYDGTAPEVLSSLEYKLINGVIRVKEDVADQVSGALEGDAEGQGLRAHLERERGLLDKIGELEKQVASLRDKAVMSLQDFETEDERVAGLAARVARLREEKRQLLEENRQLRRKNAELIEEVERRRNLMDVRRLAMEEVEVAERRRVPGPIGSD